MDCDNCKLRKVFDYLSNPEYYGKNPLSLREKSILTMKFLMNDVTDRENAQFHSLSMRRFYEIIHNITAQGK